VLCPDLCIEHPLTQPHPPQRSGVVESFNSQIQNPIAPTELKNLPDTVYFDAQRLLHGEESGSCPGLKNMGAIEKLQGPLIDSL